MRILGLAVAALVLTACSVGSVAAPVAPKVDTATAAMVALKAQAGVEDCPAQHSPEAGSSGASSPGASQGTVKAVLPDVTLPCLGGGPDVSLADLHAPLVINVFQAGCTPCQQEIPLLEAFHEAHPDITLLGLDGNDPLPAVALQEAIDYGARYPLVADPEGLLQGTALTVTGYPWFFILTADGKLISKPGGVTSATQLDELVLDALAGGVPGAGG